MVVDDDRAVLRSLERILVADGYAVTCCSSARGALDRIAQEPPDAILLDLMMPAMNGRQFLAALRDDLGRGDIPVVVITGVRGIDIKQAHSMGASDVIEKPFELDELLNKIALVIFRSRRKSGRARRATTEPGFAVSASAQAVVLLVSADDALAARMKTLAQVGGHRLVTLVRASDELPRITRALEPKAVLVDLHLPILGGMEALQRLRASRFLNSVPMMLIARDLDTLDQVRDDLAALAVTPMLQPFEDHEIVGFLDAPPASARRPAK